MNISGKLVSIMLVFVLLFCYAEIFASGSGSVIFSDAKIISGEEGKVTVSLENFDNLSSLYLYNLEFDGEILELTDVKLLAEGTALSHVDEKTGEIVFAFSENKSCSGDIAEFTFKAKGKKLTSEIKGDVKIKYWNNGSENFIENVNVVSGDVQVVSKFPATMRLEDYETEYNGKAQVIKVKNFLSGAKVSYLIDGEEKEAVNVGEYTVTAKVTKDGYGDWERTAILKITPAPLEIKGLKAEDKVYDGTKGARIDKSEAVLDGVFAEDEVYVEFPETGTFESENVKNVKINITVEKPELKGKDAANYKLKDIDPLKARITKAPQSIEVSDLPQKAYGDGTWEIYAEASSGLPLTYKSENELVAKVSENGMVEITGAGKTNIKISQAGNGNYEPCSIEKELLISPKTITFSDIDFEHETLTPSLEECGILSKDSGKVAFDFSRVKALVSSDKVVYSNFFFKGEKSGNYEVYVPGGQIEKELVKEEIAFNPPAGVTATVKKAAGTNTFIIEEAEITEISTETEVITFDFSGEEHGKVEALVLPGDFINEVAGEATLEMKLGESSALFDEAALTHLSQGIEGADVNFSFREADDGELEEAQIATKEKLDNAIVFCLTIVGVSAEDGRVSFGEGKVKVTLPYEVSGAANVKVKYLKDDGTTENITATYDKKTEKVSFTLSHFSEYVVYTEEKTSPSGGGGGGGGGGSMNVTLTFETNGGKEIAGIKAPSDTLINLDKYIGEKEGFEFAGWFLEPELKTIVTEVKLQDNMTLYAKWKETYETKIVLTIGKNEAVVNGKMVSNDTTPEIVNGRTMLPIRFIAEALSSEVIWDADKRAVTIKKGEKIIILTIDKDIALTDGNEVKLDAAPYIKNDRTYLPVRFITENLDCTVEWNETTGEVIVKK